MTLLTHGAKPRFALSFTLAEDPDDKGEPAKRASWAELQIWAGGRNLTAGLSPSGTYLTEAACPLLPIVEWLISSEEELDTLLEARLAWWMHHGLGAALPDYRIPDVHFRRSGERIEIS